MRIQYAVVSLVVLLSSTFAFADDSSKNSKEMPFKQCETIAHACKSAGFVKEGGAGKGFWHDCMKPVLLNKTVAGVKIDSKDVVACRDAKINKMQKELQEFQSVSK